VITFSLFAYKVTPLIYKTGNDGVRRKAMLSGRPIAPAIPQADQRSLPAQKPQHDL